MAEGNRESDRGESASQQSDAATPRKRDFSSLPIPATVCWEFEGLSGAGGSCAAGAVRKPGVGSCNGGLVGGGASRRAATRAVASEFPTEVQGMSRLSRRELLKLSAASV